MAASPQLPQLPPLTEILPPPDQVLSTFTANVLTQGLRSIVLAPVETLKTILETAIKNLVGMLPGR